MSRVSEYERLQIEALLLSGNRPVDSDCGLFLMPAGGRFREIFDLAVSPAMRDSGLNAQGMELAFDSDSSLAEVCRSIQTAQIIVADVSHWPADLTYVLGLCHGLGRCPLLLARDAMSLPFNLMALRIVEYSPHGTGLRDLREHLERAIRVFMAAARASGDTRPRE